MAYQELSNVLVQRDWHVSIFSFKVQQYNRAIHCLIHREMRLQRTLEQMDVPCCRSSLPFDGNKRDSREACKTVGRLERGGPASG